MRHRLFIFIAFFLNGILHIPTDAVAQPVNPVRFGVTVQDFGGEGVMVLAVQPGSWAAASGLAPGDIVLRVGNRRVLDSASFALSLAAFLAPSAATPQLQIVRGAQLLTVSPPSAASAASDNGISRLGLELADQPWGVIVVRVQPGSPAAHAGIRAGDALLQAGAWRVVNVAALERWMRQASSGAELRLKVLRQGRTRWLLLAPGVLG